MKKQLTELHLLMERTDLLFVASELVKHYKLKSKVKFGTFKKEQGGYNWDTDEIRLKKFFFLSRILIFDLLINAKKFLKKEK